MTTTTTTTHRVARTFENGTRWVVSPNLPILYTANPDYAHRFTSLLAAQSIATEVGGHVEVTR